MGGDAISPSSTTSEGSSSEGQGFHNSSWAGFSEKAEDGNSEGDYEVVSGLLDLPEDGYSKGDYEVVSGELDQVGSRFSSSFSLDFEADQRRKHRVYKEVLQSYAQLRVRCESLNEAKSKVLSYYPGAWIGNTGGMKLSDYDVPETTTLVLIGPKGCGKSSLVNRISRALEDDKFAPERAQVSYNSSVGDGTCFLQEYMVPRGSTSFCLYDTRSLSDNPSDNIDTITNWMTKGVCHGELVLRKSDVPSLRSIMKCKTRDKNCLSSKIRMVNFVIFVVDGVAVLKSMEGDGNGMTQYMQTITRAFKCPCLSLKDDKPVVVVTHGDLLSLADRVRVRVHLGELLGIPPVKQIFDIPGNLDAATELAIVDMLRYSLEHADRHIPLRNAESSYQIIQQERNPHNRLEEEKKTDEDNIMFGIFVLLIVVVAVVMAVFLVEDETEPQVDWHAIRHIW
ncbi:hypothetical protein SLE2022_249070 [Rubroshorea leprosula]